MRAYFRLLPLTMFCAFMLLAVKLGQAIESGESLFDKLFIGSVAAEEAGKKEEAPSAKTPEAASAPAKEEGTKEAKAEAGDQAEGAAKEGKKPESEAEKKEDDSDEPFIKPIFAGSKKEYKPEDLIGNQLGGTRPGDRRFSPVELQLLQQLSERRIKIDEREKKLEMKENLLNQTEIRVNEKFDEMTSLRTELAELIRRYNDIEETKVRSLVKIYENMKPKDAARIFDEVEMPILLMVIDQMSEKRAAPILASMNSKKAKAVTVELAEQRKLQDEKIANERASAMPSKAVPVAPKAK